MPEFEILLIVIAALALGIRASWVWVLRGCSAVPRWRATAGSLAVSLILLDCMFFVFLCCKGEIGGFGTHDMTTRAVGWYLLASVLATVGALLPAGESRWEALLSGTLTTALWFGSGFVA